MKLMYKMNAQAEPVAVKKANKVHNTYAAILACFSLAGKIML